ncbi:MAG: TlpA family protein disulfide reductase [Planctomycetes bacterium]|nr:TlpA family protein disulfide reductase [Planctomycetota bacterium]
MRRWIVGVFVLVCSTGTSHGQMPADVRLDLVNYKQLGEEIKKLQGQVILVDFWGDFCRPCKEKFPEVMALHRKYARQGLAVVTVSIDDISDPQVQERIRMFLRSQQASSRNLLLAEKPEVWIEKLKMNSVPTMFLFDREGRLINRWNGSEIHLNLIEKRITELLHQ